MPRGSLGRTSNYMNLDLNAQYAFEIANSELVVSFDLFNALNADTVTEVQEDDTSFFGLPTSYQSPMAYRLSARYKF